MTNQYENDRYSRTGPEPHPRRPARQGSAETPLTLDRPSYGLKRANVGGSRATSRTSRVNRFLSQCLEKFYFCFSLGSDTLAFTLDVLDVDSLPPKNNPLKPSRSKSYVKPPSQIDPPPLTWHTAWGWPLLVFCQVEVCRGVVDEPRIAHSPARWLSTPLLEVGGSPPPTLDVADGAGVPAA